MQPDFALSLSFEGIALLRRTGDAWAEIDSVPLDNNDLDAAVTALRHKAEALDPDGSRVTLIIPNEQIRYLDMPDLGGDPTSRDSAIQGALDGATPYAVAELNYDHSLANNRLLIAAVARETLAEAQDFAQNYGFKPVSYLARAEEDAFKGAVFFGACPSWKGAKPTRPAAALRIVPADEAALQPKTPAPEPAPPPAPPQTEVAPEPAPEPMAEPAPAPVAAPAPEPVQQTTTPVVAASAPQAPAEPADAPETAPDSAAPVPPAPIDEPAAVNAHAPVAPSKPEVEAPAADPEDDVPSPQIRFASIRANRDEAGTGAPPPPVATKDPVAGGPVARRFTPVPPAPNPARDAGVTSQSIEAEAGSSDDESTGKAGAAGAATAAVRFLSSRLSRKGQAEEPVPQVEDKAPPKGPLGKLKATKPDVAKTAPKLTIPEQAPSGPTPPLSKAPALAAPAEARQTLAARAAVNPAVDLDVDVQPPTAPLSKPEPQRKPGPLAALAAKRAAQTASAGAAAMTMDAERERMTVFGARNREPVGGKPRFLGLMLTAGLLVFLAAVAAWATVFLDDGVAGLFRDDEQPTAIAAAPDLPAAPIAALSETPTEPSAPALTATAPLSLPNAPTQPSAAATETGEDVQLAALDTAPSATDAPPALAVPVVPQALTPQEAATTYAATGIWQRSPTPPHLPPLDGVEDIYVASIDPAVQESDAVALPGLQGFEPDSGIADPGLPPPSDLRFIFDERNLIRATPEGALTPEGLRIFTGPPPVKPPLRSEGPAAPRLDATQTAALAAVRPSPRPTDLVEQRERATLGGSSRQELAALRPVLRPKTVQEQEVEDKPEATATARAVAKSLTPLPRPRNMERIVKQAETKREEEPVQVAAVAPRTVQPSVPSTTSVARAATVRNAINLRQINLIGVYGTSSNRRALVRLPSGGYRKVKVGDRLDGGRVSAISDSELRYAKGGRNLVLKMPR